jgi:hypothetical protein
MQPSKQNLVPKEHAVFKKSAVSTVRTVVLLGLMFLMANASYAQKALKLVEMRQVSYNASTKKWSPWPTEWQSYEEKNKPILTLTKLDDTGAKFNVKMKIADEKFAFNVTYDGFDEKNNWSKYIDENGDRINIVGSTMSKLSISGWPSTPVQIYFWIYSEKLGMEFR